MRGNALISSCDRTDPRASLRQVDARGHNRAWIVLTHIDPAERRAPLGYLDTIGTRLDVFSLDTRKDAMTASSVFPYRLDDRERLRASRPRRPGGHADR